MATQSAPNDHDLIIDLNANVKNLTLTFQSYIATSNNTASDHEGRLRTVETRQTDLMGQFTGSRRVTNVLMSILTIAVAIIGIIVTFVH